MEVYCTTCYKHVKLVDGRCPECGNILASQGTASEEQSAGAERYCSVCCKNVKLVNGGRCSECDTVLEYQPMDTNIRNLTNNFRSAIQANRGSASANSESDWKTTGMQAWEVIGIIVGLVFIIVGFVNAAKSNDDISSVYDPLTKAIYGLYVAIGSALVTYFSRKFCKK